MKKGIWFILIIILLVVTTGVTWKWFNRRPPAGTSMLTTNDGVQLSVQVTEPSGAPKAILVLAHALGGSKADWTDLAVAANPQDYATVAFDFRGSGDSQGDIRNFTQADFQHYPDDLRTVLQFTLENFGRTPIILIGASIGANAVLNVVVDPNLSSRVRGVVLLSAGEDYRGLKAADVAPQLKLPALLAVSKEDDYAFKSTQTIFEILPTESKQLIELERAGHGTAMLRNQADLIQQILDWSNEVLGR